MWKKAQDHAALCLSKALFSAIPRLGPHNLDLCSSGGIFALTESTLLAVLQHMERLPREQQEVFTRWRLERLLSLCTKHPLLPERYAKGPLSMEDFYSLRPLTRDELRIAFETAIAQNERSPFHLGPISYGRTSGTSGTPMRVPVTPRIELMYRIARKRLFALAGLKHTDNFYYPRTRPNPHFCSKNVYCRESLADLVSNLDNFFEEIKIHSVRALYAFPTFLLLAREKILDCQLTPPPLAAILCAGENLSEPMRNEIQKAFGTSAFNFYASVEMSSIGQECEAQDGLHINPEFQLVEILDEHGTRLPPNTWGNITITPLDIPFMPILRYNTGDEGLLIPEPCSCGRTLPRIRIRGRNPELIRTERGVLSTHAFKEIVDTYDPACTKIQRYQLILSSGREKLTFVILPTELLSKTELAAIEATCKRFVGDVIPFEFRTTDRLVYTGLKSPFFIREDSETYKNGLPAQ